MENDRLIEAQIEELREYMCDHLCVHAIEDSDYLQVRCEECRLKELTELWCEISHSWRDNVNIAIEEWGKMRRAYQTRYAKMYKKAKDECNTDRHGALLEMSHVLITVFGLTDKQVQEIERNEGLTDADIEEL